MKAVSARLLSFLLPPLLSQAIALPNPGLHEPRTPSGAKTVIAQMFEWTWDSIAAECTDFLGPAGYGFVQGGLDILLWSHRLSTHCIRIIFSSQPTSRTCPRASMVDGLSTCFVHPHFQTRKSLPTREHDQHMPHRGSASYYWLVQVKHDFSPSS